jgi:hypothetical protein
VRQTPVAVVMTCRLNMSAAPMQGLNVSVFEGTGALVGEIHVVEPAVESEAGATAAALDAGDGSGPATRSDAHAIYTSLQPSCSPKNALFSSGDGVYVVRPAGASIQNVELPAGTYAIVPSTFDPMCCKFDLNVYIGPITACGPGFGIKRIR